MTGMVDHRWWPLALLVEVWWERLPLCCPRLRPRKPGDGELRADAVAMCRVCTEIGRASMALIPPESVRRRLALKVLVNDWDGGKLAIRSQGVRAFVAGEILGGFCLLVSYSASTGARTRRCE